MAWRIQALGRIHSHSFIMVDHWQVSFIHPTTGQRRITARYTEPDAYSLAAKIAANGGHSLTVRPIGRECQPPL